MSVGTYWLWNGKQWLSEFAWPTADRALHYGDGLFETLRFNHMGEAPLWFFHAERLQQGLLALGFPVTSLNLIEQAFAALPKELRQSGGKLLISRGVSERGYAPAENPEIQLLWHAFTAPEWGVDRFPQGFKADFSAVKLAPQPLLAGVKHLNRLEQVLIRSRFVEGCQEMVVCDNIGNVVEGCMSNLFILKDSKLYTPKIETCGVNGVIRRWLLENEQVNVTRLLPEDLLTAEALFFCNSLNGIVPVSQLAERQYSLKYQGWQTILNLQQKLEALFC